MSCLLLAGGGAPGVWLVGYQHPTVIMIKSNPVDLIYCGPKVLALNQLSNSYECAFFTLLSIFVCATTKIKKNN